MGFGEVDDDAGSREIFYGKVWQPDDVSESVWGLGFTKAAQRFIYRRITVSMGTGDVNKAIATENNNSNEQPPSEAHC
jgi:hypothetical protein